MSTAPSDASGTPEESSASTPAAVAKPDTVNVGGKSMSKRMVLVIGGTAWWLGLMLLRTGVHGVAALADALWIMAIFIAVCTITRTVSLRQLFVMFLYGGFMMGIAVVLAKICIAVLPTSLVPVVVPTMEQLLMLIPPALLLWKGRNSWVYCLGATDVFLLCLAAGTGFELVENAYIRAAGHWGNSVIPFMPLSIFAGDRIRGEHLFNGHALWSGLAGMGLGLSLLFRGRGKVAWLIGVAAFGLGWFDHIALDYRTSAGSNWLAGLMSLFTGKGWITLIAFFGAFVAALLADCNVLYNTLPATLKESLRKLSLPIQQGGWGSILNIRRLSFSGFQVEKCSGTEREDAKVMNYTSLIRMIDQHNSRHKNLSA